MRKVQNSISSQYRWKNPLLFKYMGGKRWKWNETYKKQCHIPLILIHIYKEINHRSLPAWEVLMYSLWFPTTARMPVESQGYVHLSTLSRNFPIDLVFLKNISCLNGDPSIRDGPSCKKYSVISIILEINKTNLDSSKNWWFRIQWWYGTIISWSCNREYVTLHSGFI